MSAAEILNTSGRFSVSPGLSEAELTAIEDEFGFHFADDHRAFLSAGVPVGRKWPDWRGSDRTLLRDQFAAPIEGVLFDVGQGSFWYEGWGPAPSSAADCVAVARRYLMTVPRMVPLYAHRYLPAALAGHPVLSMVQTDVVPYGSDLSGWLHREFGLGPADDVERRATVPFWRDLIL